MTRLALLVLVVPLILGIVYSAEVSVEGGEETQISLPVMPPPEPVEVEANNVVVIPGSGVQVGSVEVADGKAKIEVFLTLPTPCYEVEKKVEVKKGEEKDEVTVYFLLRSTGEVCIQVVKEVGETVEVDVDPQKKTIVRIVRMREGKIEAPERPVVVGPVLYTAEVEGNEIVVTVEGCYEYEVVPLKCPNCYYIFVEPEGNCEKTVVKLPYMEGMPVNVKVSLKGEVGVPEEPFGRCKAVVDAVSRIDENVGQELADLCSSMPRVAYEKGCDFLEERDPEAYKKLCEEEVRLPPIEINVPEMCRKFVEELNKASPDVAKEAEVLCREAPFYEVKEKICDLLEEKNPVAYKEVCEKREMIREAVRERVAKIVGGEVNVEKLKEEIKKLKEELEKFKEEVKELRIRVQELKRKLVITRKGIVIEGEGELNVPRVEVEVEYKGKPVVVKKEENEIVLEVNGPVRAKVKVKAPVEVDKNIIAIKGMALKVLPDEAIKKIQERLRNALVEEVELEVEENRPVYKVEAKVRGRLLFILPIEVPVKAYIDAETGTEVKVERPWWAFLVIG